MNRVFKLTTTVCSELSGLAICKQNVLFNAFAYICRVQGWKKIKNHKFAKIINHYQYVSAAFASGGGHIWGAVQTPAQAWLISCKMSLQLGTPPKDSIVQLAGHASFAKPFDV